MIFHHTLGGELFFLIFRGLFFIAFLVGLIFLVIFLVKAARRGPVHYDRNSFTGTHGEPSAKEVLQIRYAKGEITQAEYKKILADLDK